MGRAEHEMEQEIREAEQWLAGWETPSPSPGSLEATKAAVREALRRQAARRSPPRRWRRGLAAAAAIALATAAGWHYLALDHGRNTIVADAEADLQQWPPETSEDATYMVNLSTDLSDLETWSSDDAWDLDGATLYRVLEGAVQSTESGEAEPILPSSYHPALTAPRIEEA